jgi:hypothetical protein
VHVQVAQLLLASPVLAVEPDGVPGLVASTSHEVVISALDASRSLSRLLVLGEVSPVVRVEPQVAEF